MLVPESAEHSANMPEVRPAERWRSNGKGYRAWGHALHTRYSDNTAKMDGHHVAPYQFEPPVRVMPDRNEQDERIEAPADNRLQNTDWWVVCLDTSISLQ